jgi:hypothetical protein
MNNESDTDTGIVSFPLVNVMRLTQVVALVVVMLFIRLTYTSFPLGWLLLLSAMMYVYVRVMGCC